MPSIDIILESQEVVVLGGPSNVEVQLDTGATGTRGSLAYAGAGLPSSSTIPNYSSILPGDLYVNTAPGANYSWLYQYLVKPAGNTWEPILQLNPALFHAVYEVAFVSGAATISIPVNSIAAGSTGLTADNFAVVCTFENVNPISFSISSKSVSGSPSNLVLEISALEYSSGSWVDFVNSNAKIALFIRVISGTTTP